jgi:starvation-inducible outer membrane lipoprotein
MMRAAALALLLAGCAASPDPTADAQRRAAIQRALAGVQLETPQTAPSTHCTHHRIGDTVYTDCR